MHYLDSITMEQGIRRAIQSVQQQIDQALLSQFRSLGGRPGLYSLECFGDEDGWGMRRETRA